MIETMVEQLSQRLQENPQDVPGWKRLARAYEVLESPNRHWKHGCALPRPVQMICDYR